MEPPHHYFLWSTLGWGRLCRGIDSVEIASWITVAACTLSFLLSGAAVLWCALFSGPAQLRAHTERGILLAERSSARCDAMDARFVEHKAETTALHEAIEGVLDAVEKKRRSTAASASRLQAATEPEPQTREEQLSLARRRVYGVG